MDKKTLAILTGFGLGGLGLGWYLLSKRQQAPSITTTTTTQTTTTVTQQLGLSITNIVYSNGQVYVTVQNTGNVEYNYYVGCTVVANGVAGTGCQLNASGNPYVDIQPQTITLQPGQQGQVVFNISSALQQLSKYSYVYVIIKGYSDQSLTQCLTGADYGMSNPYYQAPSPTPSPTPSPSPPLSPSVSAVINYAYNLGSAVVVSITNTSNTTWTFTVGATAVEGSYCGGGCDLNACGHPYADIPAQSITLAPGQTGTLTFNVGPAFQSLGITVGWVIIKVWQYAFSNCLAGTTVWVNLY